MSEDKKKLFQYIGGGLIITCAFAIMLPGLIDYLFGLWRIIALIVTIVLITVAMVFAYHKFFKQNIVSKESTQNKTENPKENR